MARQAGEVVEFWIDAGRGRWFQQDPNFDVEISGRFETLHLEIARGEHCSWRADARGLLALLLLLDQFPRNMYRGTARAFATNSFALAVAQEAVGGGFDLQLTLELQPFLYLPFEH